MMDPDKDLPFGDISGVSVDDDARRSRVRQRSPEPARASDHSSSVAHRPPEAHAPRRAVAQSAPALGRGWLLPLVVVALLIALVVLSYVGYTRIAALQARLNQQQSQASTQIDTLKSQISATGNSASQTSDKLGQNLTDQNRELQRQSANGAVMRKQLQALEAATAKLDASVKQLSELSAQVSALQKQQKVMEITSSQMQMQQDLNSSGVKKLTASADAQARQLKGLANAPDELAQVKRQLQEVQASIKAFDRWRVQVNNQLQPATGK